ncbi:MAG: LysR family transcriptional regulator [Spirochaetales bacterium]|nr:LysR family transcriptional regulator [Spirochaetales bacterium]MBO6048253.1 LysR family transcriptional regulator [Spirochaetales bacterium]MBO7348508.1 LysR family transcriptional regulator [Spirochaetales bacterium]MBP5756903.1 LysR family transcriptional regulator [Spirochaetales bacterium]
MNLKVKLYLESDKGKFMGIGVLWLLEKVKACGSLRSAAAELGISYSKAFRMVQNLETELGVEVLERKRGGMQRTGASLTRFGEDFICLYDTFQRECKVLLDKPFYDFSNKLDSMLETAKKS